MKMKTIKEIIKNKYNPIVNNGNKSKLNNDNNDNNDKKRYALDRSKFTPNTEEALLAEEIATKLNDLDNFACYFSVVNRIGASKARTILSQTIGEIKEKAESKYPVRKPARYFMWKVKYGH
jgi:hypothetical protein